jgi:hypothetical protein
MLDDLTESAMKRTVRKQVEIQGQMRADGADLASVMSRAMIADIAITLVPVVGKDATETFLQAARDYFVQIAAMTDLEWAGYEHNENPTLPWAELAVTHLGPHLEDAEEARHVGILLCDVLWHMSDLALDDGWVTSLMKRVTSCL